MTINFNRRRMLIGGALGTAAAAATGLVQAADSKSTAKFDKIYDVIVVAAPRSF